MKRGDVWWASLGAPRGAEPGFRRPAVIISANEFNDTPIRTVIVAYLTTNADRSADPGNVWLTARKTGLTQNSVLNVTQLATVDRRTLTEKVGHLPDNAIREIDDGLRLVLGV
ncbi:MAG: type II toxin-antitoxin system PemK/MazF family toxin [Hyphomicrobium sp.]